jgi:hypothetical protein
MLVAFQHGVLLDESPRRVRVILFPVGVGLLAVAEQPTRFREVKAGLLERSVRFGLPRVPDQLAEAFLPLRLFLVMPETAEEEQNQRHQCGHFATASQGTPLLTFYEVVVADAENASQKLDERVGAAVTFQARIGRDGAGRFGQDCFVGADAMQRRLGKTFPRRITRLAIDDQAVDAVLATQALEVANLAINVR